MVERSGVVWAELERVAPELAARGRELLDRWGFVFVGTARADGTPRISPVEVHIVGGHLMLAMITGSRKAVDVRRDPRITLQTPLTDPADPGAELKAQGQLEAVDEDQQNATAASIEETSGWRPSEFSGSATGVGPSGATHGDGVR